MTHSTETCHFLDMSTEMFARLHFDGDFVPLNPAWEQTLGYTRAELQRQPWFSLVHAEDRGETLAAIDRLKTGECTTVAFENRVQCKDASYRWFRWHAMLPAAAEPVCYIVARDVTRQRRVDAKLKASEHRLKHLVEAHTQDSELLHTLMENTPDHIYFKDTESQFIRINRALAEQFGLKNPADAVDKTDFDYFTREHAQQAYHDEKTVIETGKPLKAKVERETWPDGKDTWVSTTKVPIRDRNGRIQGTCGISRDITEYHRTVQALQDSEARWRSLVQSAPYLISTTNLAYQIEFLNRVPGGIGLTTADIIGRSIFDFLTVEHHAGFRKACAKVIETGKVATYEVQGRVSGNWYATCIGPIRRNGNLVGFVMNSADITDRRQTEQAVQRAKDAAEHASRAKSDFLANMSHELRTPLNAIIGFAEILRDELVGSINTGQKECVIDIHTSGQHLLEMINDILDLSKIEAGKMVMQLDTFSIVDAMQEVNAIISALAAKKDLELSLQVQHDATIEADRVKFKQIFYNLLSNAVKFTPPGGKVATHLEITDTHLCAEVIDTGIGIAEEDRRKLFAPFTQIDTSESRRYGGTGLGLALTRRLVDLHGGEISVKHSEEGKGSNFAVKLPRQQTQNASL